VKIPCLRVKLAVSAVFLTFCQLAPLIVRVECNNCTQRTEGRVACKGAEEKQLQIFFCSEGDFKHLFLREFELVNSF